jgi:YggT family protein
MELAREVATIALTVFLIFLVARMVLDWTQFFARDYRPHGAMLIVFEAVYSVTDPPLKAFRRFIPPLRLGQVQLDLAFMVVFFLVLVALILVRPA